MTMTTTATRFSVSGNVTLDGSGYGIIRLSPTGEKWEIDRIYVGTGQTSPTSEARVKVYLGVLAPQAVIDGTYSGSSGDTSDSHIYLEDGQALYLEWTGGDAGVLAIANLSGWKSTPEGGFRAIH